MFRNELLEIIEEYVEMYWNGWKGGLDGELKEC